MATSSSPRTDVEVHACDLVVTRAERDRFEHATQSSGDGPDEWLVAGCRFMSMIECSGDGSWIKVCSREYLFPACSRKRRVRRLYDALQDGSPKLPMQSLLEEIELRSRHISQVFSGADPKLAGNHRLRQGARLAQGRHVTVDCSPRAKSPSASLRAAVLCAVGKKIASPKRFLICSLSPLLTGLLTRRFVSCSP